MYLLYVATSILTQTVGCGYSFGRKDGGGFGGGRGNGYVIGGGFGYSRAHSNYGGTGFAPGHGNGNGGLDPELVTLIEPRHLLLLCAVRALQPRGEQHESENE